MYHALMCVVNRIVEAVAAHPTPLVATSLAIVFACKAALGDAAAFAALVNSANLCRTNDGEHGSFSPLIFHGRSVPGESHPGVCHWGMEIECIGFRPIAAFGGAPNRAASPDITPDRYHGRHRDARALRRLVKAGRLRIRSAVPSGGSGDDGNTPWRWTASGRAVRLMTASGGHIDHCGRELTKTGTAAR